MISQADIVRMLEDVGAIRNGHFELSSGRHSSSYIQCALVLQHPPIAEKLGRALAEEFHGLHVDCVASPALGGVILGHEVARALGVRAIFSERDASGRMVLRRGFSVAPGEKVLVVEDVWTTGGSTRETIGVIEEAGGCVVGVGAIMDRSGGSLEFPVRAESLLESEFHSFEPEECPLCRSGSAAVRPGSRFSRASG
ncbi:MAG: orotate phosphoribosyltransferase [Candidatus Acidiferrales bacterium]